MKKFFSFVVVAMMAIPTFAQITEGEPRADVLPTGNRLEKGVWGVYVGAGVTMDKKDKEFNDAKFRVSPLVNVKYMFTDRIEGRLGVEFGKNKTRVGYTVEAGEEGATKDGVVKNVLAHNYFNPGVAYHFSKKNLLDVYAGAELPFGWERNTTIGELGDYKENTYQGQFNIGAGAFIGLQAFIGRLPLALGLEYGIQTMFTAGAGKTKTVSYDGEKEQTSYTHELLGGSATKMSARKGEILSQARITLSYYFK